MAQGALLAIQTLLDDGKIPRGTFADDQVRNLVAMYNQQKEMAGRLAHTLETVLITDWVVEGDGKPARIGEPIAKQIQRTIDEYNALVASGGGE